MPSLDPFQLDQQALDNKLKLLQESLERWRRVKIDAGELTSQEELQEAEDEFNWLREEIGKSVKSIGWDLDDLAETLRRMSEQNRQPAEETTARGEYIRRMRHLLTTIDDEVKKSSEASAASESPDGRQNRHQQQQQPDSGMSASTERLVESLLQQDDEDDDVELLIQDDSSVRGRRQFSVAVDEQPASPMMRLWRNHRPAVVFVGVVALLLLIILIVSLTSGEHRSKDSGPFLFLLLMLHRPSNCFVGREQIMVDGNRRSPDSRGAFVSDNFPHPLPLHSICIYEFRVYYSGSDESNAMCFQFQEMKLFTADEISDQESVLEVRYGTLLAHPLLAYAGNGSLLREADEPDGLVIARPENLRNGSLCLKIKISEFYWRYYVTVINYKFIHNSNSRLTRFLALYEAININDPNWQTNPGLIKSTETQHRCLDGTYVDKSDRCNTVNDCENYFNSSDFFEGLSSDESYEHARCNSTRSFGTNFARGQASAHSLADIQLDCTMDHSRLFSSLSDSRDCSLMLQPKSAKAFIPELRLSGLLAAGNPGSATCYRFFWFSSGFNKDDEALTLAEPNGGKALLRLPARWRFYTWSIAEVQIEPGFTGSSIDALAIQSEQQNRTIGTYWLDDLSAEPAACNDSAYGKRMLSICSFEWSTCGWKTNYLTVVTDASVEKEFGVNMSDHTSSSVLGRRVPRLPQRMLHMTPETSWMASIWYERSLSFGSSWCFDIWVYGLGDGDYSFKIDVIIDLLSGIESWTFLTLTVPNNQWRLLSGTFGVEAGRQSRHPNVAIRFRVKSSNTTRAVFLDDMSIVDDSCFRQYEVNGTVECGILEWLCSDRKQCVQVNQICDGHFDCGDQSDEAHCFVAAAPNWTAILPLSVVVILLLLLGACQYSRLRSARSSHQGNFAAQSTGLDELPEAPPSYEEATEGLPKYEELHPQH
uniref:MAM domain-containing protein n=1 Tax=Macrostomum lignano TaxID=282301 RepID=A0A1I8GS94_9PLAT